MGNKETSMHTTDDNATTAINDHLAITLVLGPPASGKGTQSKAISSARSSSSAHLSLGEVIRAEISSGSALGSQLDDYYSHGRFVPDHIALKTVLQSLEHLQELGASDVMLDGFPRTQRQAEMLA